MAGAASMCEFCSASGSCSICASSIYKSPVRLCNEEYGDAASEVFKSDSVVSDCVTPVSGSTSEPADFVLDKLKVFVIKPEAVEPSRAATLPTFVPARSEATHNITAANAMADIIVESTSSGKRASKMRRTRSPWTVDEETRFAKALDKLSPLEESVIASNIPGGRISVRLPHGVTELLALIVGTRTTIQVRSHVQKYYLRKLREMGPGWKCKHTSWN